MWPQPVQNALIDTRHNPTGGCSQVVFILVLADFRPVLGCIVLINQTVYLCRRILNFGLVPYPVSVQLWLTGSHHMFELNLNQLEHAACWNQTLWTMPSLTPVLGSWIDGSSHNHTIGSTFTESDLVDYAGTRTITNYKSSFTRVPHF
jgi:hypothetical protein